MEKEGEITMRCRRDGLDRSLRSLLQWQRSMRVEADQTNSSWSIMYVFSLFIRPTTLWSWLRRALLLPPRAIS